MVCSCHPAGLCGGDDLCGVQRRGTAVASPRSGVLSSSTVELNREIGVQWIKYKLPQAVEFANSLGLLIGDAVHNLHTALDYAWIWALLTRGYGIGKRSKFPFRQTAEELKAALAGIEIKSTDPLFDLLITGIKPYPAGNDLLCLLHGLDITDKHHLLMPLVQVAEVNGIATEDSAGVLMITGTTPIRGENPFYVDIPMNQKIKDNGKPSVTVLFGKVPAAQNEEILSTLTLFTESVLHAVQAIESVSLKV